MKKNRSKDDSNDSNAPTNFHDFLKIIQKSHITVNTMVFMSHWKQ